MRVWLAWFAILALLSHDDAVLASASIAGEAKSALGWRRSMKGVLARGTGSGGSVKSGQPAAGGGQSRRAAEGKQLQSCVASVASGDAGMKALEWLLFVDYSCAFTNRGGCAALVLSAKLPFKSDADIHAALASAAEHVSTCVASAGRGLKAWGADLLYTNKVFDNWRYDPEDPGVTLGTLTSICSKAAAMAQSGETLAELDRFGALDTVAATINGLAQAYLTLYTSSLGRNPFLSLGLGLAENEIASLAFTAMFSNENIRDCWSAYSMQGCVELSGSWNADIAKWARDEECKKCAASVQAVCQNHISKYNDKFSDVSGSVNFVASLAAGSATSLKNIAQGRTADYIKKQAGAALLAYPLSWYESFKAGFYAQVEKRSATEIKDALDAESIAIKWRERWGMPPDYNLGRLKTFPPVVTPTTNTKPETPSGQGGSLPPSGTIAPFSCEHKDCDKFLNDP